MKEPSVKFAPFEDTGGLRILVNDVRSGIVMNPLGEPRISLLGLSPTVVERVVDRLRSYRNEQGISTDF